MKCSLTNNFDIVEMDEIIVDLISNISCESIFHNLRLFFAFNDELH